MYLQMCDVRAPDTLKTVASLDCAVRSPAHAPHGELRLLIHRPQRTCFIGNPASQLVLRRWVEGWLKQGGLIKEPFALLSGVKPVGGGTSQVEDASPAIERAVEQVQDGA